MFLLRGSRWDGNASTRLDGQDRRDGQDGPLRCEPAHDADHNSDVENRQRQVYFRRSYEPRERRTDAVDVLFDFVQQAIVNIAKAMCGVDAVGGLG